MDMFLQHLTQAREALGELRSRSHERPATIAMGDTYPEYRLEEETAHTLQFLQALVSLDVMRYRPRADQHDEVHANNKAQQPAAAPNEQALADLGAQMADKMRTKSEAFNAHFLNIGITSPFLGDPPPEGLDTHLAETLGVPGRAFYRLMHTEIEEMARQLAAQNIPVTTLQKLRKALRLLAEDRFGDAQTVMRTAKQDDPHNRYMAYCQSQMLFFKAAQGFNEYLPEAREEAKRCCLYGDKFDSGRLLFYRYHCAATELYFDPVRALDVMREHFLLSPDSLASPEGLASHGGLHLKSLLLLTMIPMEHWGTYEIEAIATMAEKAVGGLALYIHFFRPAIIKHLQENDPVYSRFRQLEEGLNILTHHYNIATTNLRTRFDDNGNLIDGPAHLWTIPARFIQIFITALPIPTFDDIAQNLSLDCRHWNATPNLDVAIRERGLHLESFWATWAAKLAPNPDINNPSIIPEHIVIRDSGVLKYYDQLILDIKHYEERKINPERWAQATPYISPFSYEKMMEMGTGRTLSPSQRGPDDPTYKPYYQAWSQNIPNDHLPSKLFEKRAEAGAFWNPEEIQAMFDGAERMIDDPIVGIEARQRVGFRKYLQLHSKSSKIDSSLDTQKLMREHIAEFWWFYFILVPLSILTFIVVVSASTYQNAFNILAVLFFVAAVGGFMVYRVMGQKNVNRKKIQAAYPPEDAKPAGHSEQPADKAETPPPTGSSTNNYA